MNKKRVPLVIIALCTVICFTLFKITADINYQNQPYSETQESSRGYDSSEQNIMYLTLEGKDAFDETLTAIGSTLINQLYQKHYDMTRLLERRATIEGGVETNDKVHTFKVRFHPSEELFIVKITIKNLDTNDYDLTMDKVR